MAIKNTLREISICQYRTAWFSLYWYTVTLCIITIVLHMSCILRFKQTVTDLKKSKCGACGGSVFKLIIQWIIHQDTCRHLLAVEFTITLCVSLCICRWPRTLAGITAYLPCKRQVTGAGIYSGSSAEDRRAWRRCDRGGQWAEDDYSRCEYMKDVTRVLYIINQVWNFHVFIRGVTRV